MTVTQILAALKKAGNESTRKIFLKHGASEPVYGVKVEDIKKIMKTVTDNRQSLALELFASGVGEAQYMAGLLADGGQMTATQLQDWAARANWPMISEYTVPWVACENPGGWELALQWIDSPKSHIACSGWATLGCITSTWPDEKLPVPALKKLLSRIEKHIETAPNRVRYCMNGFVITAGSYVNDLNPTAIETGRKIGKVEVDMGGTACKVPFAPDYIRKATDRGALTKKKKTAKC